MWIVLDAKVKELLGKLPENKGEREKALKQALTTLFNLEGVEGPDGELKGAQVQIFELIYGDAKEKLGEKDANTLLDSLTGSIKGLLSGQINKITNHPPVVHAPPFGGAGVEDGASHDDQTVDML